MESIEIRIESGHVCLRCSGTHSLPGMIAVFQAAMDAALQHDKCKILIDARGVTGQIPFMDRYDSSKFLAEQVKERAPGRIKKVAMVFEAPMIDPSRFGQTVAINRGLNTKMFSEIDEAVEWLGRESVTQARIVPTSSHR